MLTKLQISEALQNPSMIASLDINALQETLQQYPYCEPLRSLYLKALVDADDVRAEEMLQQSSIYISNRRWLWDLLFGEVDRLKPVDLESLTPSSGDYFGTVGKDEKDVSLKEMAHRLRERRKARKQQEAESLLTQETATASSAILEDSAQGEVSLADIKATIAAIVETPDMVASESRGEEPVPQPQKSTDKGAEIEAEMLPATEEMARQMIKEKKFSEALQILRRLIVENPEKSVYFAPQIRFVETILSNLIN
ncbi:MAG: hypothetical protein MJZ96_02325 [Paludibacteraceae bacterium]|nr:hypothetical protein [Paludibacteraceae bacterium]